MGLNELEHTPFDGHDREKLQSIDVRLAVLESRVAFVTKSVSFVTLTIVAGVLAAVMNLVLK